MSELTDADLFRAKVDLACISAENEADSFIEGAQEYRTLTPWRKEFLRNAFICGYLRRAFAEESKKEVE